MKKLSVSLLVIWLLAALASCGASSTQVKTAREARYKAEPAAIFAEVKAALQGSYYELAAVDEGTWMVRTQPRWHTPDGQVDSARGNNMARIQENSINLSVVVRVVKGEGDVYSVAIEPVVLRMPGLSSNPEPVDIKDPSLPGWVQGKVDSLQMDIYDRIKQYAVPVGTAPAGAAPAPAPAAPAPADGSAAPTPEAAPAPAPAP